MTTIETMNALCTEYDQNWLLYDAKILLCGDDLNQKNILSAELVKFMTENNAQKLICLNRLISERNQGNDLDLDLD